MMSPTFWYGPIWRRRIPQTAASLLAGLIVDADGNRMTPSHATKRAKRYRYYVSASLLTGDRPQTQNGMRVPAGVLPPIWWTPD
jgi:hypothetical protein